MSELAGTLLRCWGKTDREHLGPERFHPALFHMLDVGHVARELLSDRVSPRWRRLLAVTLGAEANTLAEWLPWLIAAHDLGKLSASFQGQVEEQKARLQGEGFTFGSWRPSLDAGTPHSLISQIALAAQPNGSPAHSLPEPLWEAWLATVQGHHGLFADAVALKKARAALQVYEPRAWAELRGSAERLLQQLLLRRVPEPWPTPPNLSTAIMALTGFTILCDWLGSDGAHFPLCPDRTLADYAQQSAAQARASVQDAGFGQPSRSIVATGFADLFPALTTPRPLQRAVDDIPEALLAGPCLAIIEAPTGEGKTEAALALAHRLAQAGGSNELYYALPTMATSNQMFLRLERHLRENLDLPAHAHLVHGQAFLVEDDLRLTLLGNGREESEAALEWFGPKKRALLAPFGVGTIDQAELAALNVRHTALRMVGLAGKVIIVDEVHAYDTYMTTIVERLLEWLAAMGISVILLSATLPQDRRLALACAYSPEAAASLSGQSAYPSLWVLGARGSYHAEPPAQQPDRQLALQTLHLDDEEKGRADWLLGAVADGGCACWITNTVERAQRAFERVQQLASPDVDCLLLHARFPLDERQLLEKALSDRYGPTGKRPKRGIVIGTQVLEQSLDLDFDVMVSDLAPVDLLLQRAGRLHRHAWRQRPAAHLTPVLWVNWEADEQGELQLGVDRWVYAEYLLRQTWQTLQGRAELHLPADYRELIEAVYGATPPAPGSALAAAWNDLQKQQQLAIQEARLRLLPPPDPQKPFCESAARMSFEENEDSAAWIVAQTRLGEPTVTVIPLEREGDEALLPTGERLSLHAPAPREIQLQLLRRNLRISQRDAVAALEATRSALPKLFADSPLLRNCLPLWLTGGLAYLPAKRGTLRLQLDPRLGLLIRKEER